MRAKVVKRLRRKAQAITIGQSKNVTRKLYRKLKRDYTAPAEQVVKPLLSKRAARILAHAKVCH